MIEVFFSMVAYTILAFAACAAIFIYIHTVTYKIIAIFILLIFISNIYAKKCMFIYNQ